MSITCIQRLDKFWQFKTLQYSTIVWKIHIKQCFWVLSVTEIKPFVAKNQKIRTGQKQEFIRRLNDLTNVIERCGAAAAGDGPLIPQRAAPLVVWGGASHHGLRRSLVTRLISSGEIDGGRRHRDRLHALAGVRGLEQSLVFAAFAHPPRNDDDQDEDEDDKGDRREDEAP